MVDTNEVENDQDAGDEVDTGTFRRLVLPLRTFELMKIEMWSTVAIRGMIFFC